MAIEYCPECNKAFHIFYVQDEEKPRRLFRILCPYGGHFVRAEETSRIYVARSIDTQVTASARMNNHPHPLPEP